MKHRLTAIILIVCLSFVVFPYIIFAEPDVEAEETTVWKSSDYLNPDNPVTENNPWSVETTNNAEGVWQLVTGTTMTESAQPLFPTMPDGQQPTTGYISTGNYSGNWGNEGVNMAVNGKYMVPGSFWTGASGDDIKSPNVKIAKVFTVPKTGKIHISAVGGEILSNHITWAEDTMGWVVSKSDGTEIWKKVYSDRVEGSSYDTVAFDDQFIDVTEGEKIYFILQPQKWAIRAEQACIWDPQIAYAKEIVDTGSYLSSEYLDPESFFAGTNPWSVEATNNAAGVWESVTNTSMTTPSTGDEFRLFPEMPDGVTPTTGYISTGNYSGNWGNEGVNAAVNGKYMIAGAFWTSGDDSKKAVGVKIAKVFTVPEDGIIRIDAAAVMGDETEGLIVPSKVDEEWENEIAWSVEKNKKELWRETGEARRLGQSSYDSIRFHSLYEKVYAGEKIYFVFSPRKWSVRDGQSCMWDPRVTYIGKEIRVDDSSRDKADMTYPIDHQFELMLTGAPLASISASNITISGGDGRAKAADVVSNGDTLTFKVDGLQEDMDYKLCVNDIACAPKLDGEFVYANIDFPFSTAEACSLQSGIFAENGLHTGENKVCASVVCSDRTKIANGDTFIMIAAVMNSDGSVHKVYTNGASMNSRITDISCNVTVAEGQWIRAWVAESLNHIKPFSSMVDITR